MPPGTRPVQPRFQSKGPQHSYSRLVLLYLWFACSINSGGAIIGIAATSTGQLHGYLLTPSDPALGSSGIGGKRAGGCGADRTGMVSGAQTKYY